MIETPKIPKSVNLDSENMKLIKELFHEFGFPNFSRTLNAVLAVVRNDKHIKEQIKDRFLRGVKE